MRGSNGVVILLSDTEISEEHMADQFEVGSYVRVRHWHEGAGVPPLMSSDLYQVLTTPCLLGRRMSRVTYPDRVDELSVDRLIAVTATDLVVAATDRSRFNGLTTHQLVSLFTGSPG